VSNERAAAQIFTDVYGCCVMCPTGYLRAGVVEAWSTPVTGLLDVGRYPHGVDGRVEEIAEAFRSSTFESLARSDIMAWKYRKLMMNLGNAVEALVGPGARAGAVTAAATSEAEACYRAVGIGHVSADADRQRRSDLLRIGRIDRRERGGGSTWQSLARSAGSVETDHLSGETAAIGDRVGVPTPVNAGLQRLVRQQLVSGAPPGAMSVDDVRLEVGLDRPVGDRR